MGYDLYGGEPPHQKHSETSKAAARSIKKKIGPMHARIIAHLSGRNFCSDEQLVDQLGIGANTLRPRRCELVEMGIVKDTGTTCICKSGKDAVLWGLAVELSVRRGK